MSEMVQLLMLQEVTRGRKRRDDAGGEDDRASGLAKAIHRMHDHRRALKAHPKRFIAEFRHMAMGELNVQGAEP